MTEFLNFIVADIPKYKSKENSKKIVDASTIKYCSRYEKFQI